MTFSCESMTRCPAVTRKKILWYPKREKLKLPKQRIPEVLCSMLTNPLNFSVAFMAKEKKASVWGKPNKEVTSHILKGSSKYYASRPCKWTKCGKLTFC